MPSRSLSRSLARSLLRNVGRGCGAATLVVRGCAVAAILEALTWWRMDVQGGGAGAGGDDDDDDDDVPDLEEDFEAASKS